jgi:hypothetical protein
MSSFRKNTIIMVIRIHFRVKCLLCLKNLWNISNKNVKWPQKIASEIFQTAFLHFVFSKIEQKWEHYLHCHRWQNYYWNIILYWLNIISFFVLVCWSDGFVLCGRHLKSVMSVGESGNERWELDWAENESCNSRTVWEAEEPATWSHHDSAEPFTKGWKQSS